MQSTYDADPRFARAPARPAAAPCPAPPPPREFRYVEPGRKVYREALGGERSGLAYVAGYTGLVYLFRYATAGTLLETFGGGTPVLLLIYAWGMSAPVALALGLRAGRVLDHTRGLRGKLPALTGFTIGLIGTINLSLELLEWLWVVRR